MAHTFLWTTARGPAGPAPAMLMPVSAPRPVPSAGSALVRQAALAPAPRPVEVQLRMPLQPCADGTQATDRRAAAVALGGMSGTKLRAVLYLAHRDGHLAGMHAHRHRQHPTRLQAWPRTCPACCTWPWRLPLRWGVPAPTAAGACAARAGGNAAGQLRRWAGSAAAARRARPPQPRRHLWRPAADPPRAHRTGPVIVVMMCWCTHKQPCTASQWRAPGRQRVSAALGAAAADGWVGAPPRAPPAHSLARAAKQSHWRRLARASKRARQGP